MDANKINCRECKRNNGFWAHVFRAIKNIDAEGVGSFLMIISFIIGLIAFIIKLTSILQTLDAIILSCGLLFIIGMLMKILTILVN